MTAFNPAAGAAQPGQPQPDMKKVFEGERDALNMLASSISTAMDNTNENGDSTFALNGVEERLLNKWRQRRKNQKKDV